jgi:hypothetical protein
MNPSKTLSTTFRDAFTNIPSWTLRKVSNSNVEKVVYPPISPTGMRYRQLGPKFAFAVSTVTLKPIRNEPEMLMTNVPYGKRVPILAPI